MKSLKLDPSQRGKKRKGAQDFPLPRGAAFKEVKGPPDPDELAKLMETKRAGDCFLNARQYLIAWLVESDH
jgi:hypothetical protein